MPMMIFPVLILFFPIIISDFELPLEASGVFSSNFVFAIVNELFFPISF